MQVVIKECVQRIICIDVEALLEGLVNGLACMLPKTLPFAAGLLEQRLASSFQTEVAAAGKLFLRLPWHGFAGLEAVPCRPCAMAPKESGSMTKSLSQSGSGLGGPTAAALGALQLPP